MTTKKLQEQDVALIQLARLVLEIKKTGFWFLNNRKYGKFSNK